MMTEFHSSEFQGPSFKRAADNLYQEVQNHPHRDELLKLIEEQMIDDLSD